MFRCCHIFMDDVVVFSPSFEQHLEDLRKVFMRLRNVNLTLKVSKCSFFQAEVPMLGFIVGRRGIFPIPEKLRAVTDMPSPKSVREVRQVLGFLEFYRRFIKDFSKIAAPMSNLLKDDFEFDWSKECESAFIELKSKLLSAPILKTFFPDKETIIQCDASGIGLGAVLLQRHDGNLHPIAFASRLLSKHEKNYSVTEVEALSVIFALDKFRSYCYGQDLEIQVDHHSLCSLLRTKQP